jgi:hypothetical protein
MSGQLRCAAANRPMSATAHISIAAVSLIVSRLQFAHPAYKTPHLDIFELNSFETQYP